MTRDAALLARPNTPAPVASRGTHPPDVAFMDVEGAQRWLKTLPLTNVSQLTTALEKQLRAMADIDYAPRERARIAELMREQVAHVHNELARRYAGKPQPAAERELEAAEQAIGLWQALWSQYSMCLKPLLDGDPDLQGVKPKLLQRGLYVGKQLVLVYGLARRSPPPSVWQEIHAYFRLAEILDCAGTAVSDDLMPNAVGISCHSTYSHALLLALADPCAMTVKQIELTDRWLQMWARKIFPYPNPRESEGPVLLIDLEAGVGPGLVSSAPKQPTASMRFGYPHKLSTSVRGRIKRLQTGADPAELQLGRDCGIDQCTLLLSHVDAKWYQLPRSTTGLPTSMLALCGGGLPAAFFRVSGQTFEGADNHTTYQSGARALHLQTLGATAQYDRGRDEAERTFSWEDWQGTYEAREAALTRVGAMRYRWGLEQLVVVRDGDRQRLGYVSRVAQGAGELQMALRLFSAKPQATIVRGVTSALAEDPPLPCMLLPATLEDKAMLILPPRTFSPGRVIRTMMSGPERKWRLNRLLQRGADFERVSYEEIE